MGLEEKTINILHPDPYVERQVMPVLENNKMTSEVVWTYIVARKYQADSMVRSQLTTQYINISRNVPELAWPFCHKKGRMGQYNRTNLL
jgi:hypothetical protein